MDSFNLTYDDYLAHYGIKGMKWGSRKRGTSGGSSGSSKHSSSTAKGEPNKHEKTKKIAMGAAGAALLAGGAALAYANRNNPSVRRGLDSVAKISKQMKNKTVDSFDSAALGRAAKRGQKLNSKNPLSGKSIYEVANMTAPKSARKTTPQVDRMMKKVSEGRSYKDALADEAVRYGAKLTGQYAKEKVRRKFSRQS